jgi:hypothetical protein
LDLKEFHDPVSVALDDLVGCRDQERAVAVGDLKSRRDLTDHLPYPINVFLFPNNRRVL